MKKLWLQYVARIEALKGRERVIVFAAGVFATVAIVFLTTVDPAQRRSRTLLAQIETQKAEIAALDKGAGAPTDPDAANRARAEALRAQIGAADEQLKGMQRDLVPAGQMNTLLQEMLARDNRLTLVSLKTLAVDPLVSTGDKGARDKGIEPPKGVPESAHVYKHGVEITVQGSYASFHEYLSRLERSPWRMYWWRARLNADEEARLTLTVTVYTLSLDRAWLQV